MNVHHRKLLIILTPGFPADENDTTCLPMQQQLVLAVNRRFPDWTVKILAFQYPFKAGVYQWHGNEVVSFGGKNRGHIWRLMVRLRVLRSLTRISAKHKINGLFSFWLGECALVGKSFAERHQLKHFCWLLGQDARPGNPYPRRTSISGTQLIALSDFLQAEYEKNHGIKPSKVIIPGISGRLLTVNGHERDVDLLGVGSLIPLKNFDLFIDIVAEIKNVLPGVKAVIIGDGPEKTRLKEKIRHAALEPNIILTGQLGYLKVMDYMKRSRLLLHPSSYEGFSGVCMEAAAAGADVISFCRPMKTLGENWTIVDSPQQMYESALNIITKQFPEKSRQSIYHIDDTAEKIISLFS